MIQGGGHLEDMSPKDQKLEPILNEANNGLKNDRGTIAIVPLSFFKPLFASLRIGSNF